jgi:EmrB/QacA subfamily drug resistance transporter
MAAPTTTELDPRRWLAAATVIVSVLIPVLDTTILFNILETIQRDFHTELPSLQWVVTGYSITFATFLVIGGRLGDMFGHRRVFMIGVTLFGTGSFIAVISNSVFTLFFGEALIEGIGAALMMPATLAILTSHFEGRERAKAFAAWGTVAGAAVFLGPLIGGLLATNFSWRWAFGINVIVAPLILLGAIAFMHPDTPSGPRPKLDIPGACLVAAGSFSLIFALSNGARYGWWTPIAPVTVSGTTVWPASRALSLVPIAFVVSFVALTVFVIYERRREARDEQPLFEFSLLRLLTFRWGLLASTILAMGQFAFLFVVPLMLQVGEGLSAVEAGAWLFPMGFAVFVGAPIGGWLSRYTSLTSIVRIGLVMQVIALVQLAIVAAPGISFVALIPSGVLFGLGIGFGSSQLTNVVLSDIPEGKVGVASGTHSTMRQAGQAVGIATFTAVIFSFTIRDATSALRSAPLSEPVRTASLAAVRAKGLGVTAPPGTSAADATTLHDALTSAVMTGARAALLFAAVVVTIGTVASFLIPKVTVVSELAIEPDPAGIA